MTTPFQLPYRNPPGSGLAGLFQGENGVDQAKLWKDLLALEQGVQDAGGGVTGATLRSVITAQGSTATPIAAGASAPVASWGLTTDFGDATALTASGTDLTNDPSYTVGLWVIQVNASCSVHTGADSFVVSLGFSAGVDITVPMIFGGLVTTPQAVASYSVERVTGGLPYKFFIGNNGPDPITSTGVIAVFHGFK